MKWLKQGVFIGGLVPLVVIIRAGATGSLGANPISTMLNQFGYVAMIFLIASLSCTPIKVRTGWTWPLRLRKMLGLFGFYYASLHLLTYVGLDQLFDFETIVEDITARPFIIVGAVAFTLLIPLAATSRPRSVRRLGKNWARLHALVYVIAPLVIVHFYMRMKADVTQPVIYGVIVGILLLMRIKVPSKKADRRAADAG